MANNGKLTPIQQKMLALLSDGQAHSKRELHGCLSDTLVDINTIRFHLSGIRKFLRPQGRDILCDGLSGCYRMIRYISMDE